MTVSFQTLVLFGFILQSPYRLHKRSCLKVAIKQSEKSENRKR
jgi:hypothetical protein